MQAIAGTGAEGATPDARAAVWDLVARLVESGTRLETIRVLPQALAGYREAKVLMGFLLRFVTHHDLRAARDQLFERTLPWRV